MDITFPLPKVLLQLTILLFSNQTQPITGIINNPKPVIEPSPIDPGISHPAAYPVPNHHDYHHGKCTQ